MNKEKSQTAINNTIIRDQGPIGMPIIAKISQNKDINTASNHSTTTIANCTIHENKDSQEIMRPSKLASITHQPNVSHDLSNNNNSSPSQKLISEPKQINEDNTSKGNDVGELVKILKMRLVKGEITKEEFIELRGLVEN